MLNKTGLILLSVIFLSSCNGGHDCQKIAAAVQDKDLTGLTGYDLRMAKSLDLLSNYADVYNLCIKYSQGN